MKGGIRTPKAVNAGLLADLGRARGRDRRRQRIRAAVLADPALRRRARRARRGADRRRRHAGRDLDPERVHGPVRGRGGHRAGQHGADRGGHARRRVRLDPDQADGRRDEPLDRERVLRRRRHRRRRRARRARAAAARRAPRSAADVAIQLSYARLVVVVPGLRHGRRPGPARRRRPRHRAREARRRGPVRDPSGRRPHARPHERAARRGRRPLRPAQGDGRHQRRVRPHRRLARDRRQRRHQPRRADRRRLADLRHADPRRRQVRQRDRAQAVDDLRLRRASTTRSSTTPRPRCSSATRSPRCHEILSEVQAL